MNGPDEAARDGEHTQKVRARRGRAKEEPQAARTQGEPSGTRGSSRRGRTLSHPATACPSAAGTGLLGQGPGAGVQTSPPCFLQGLLRSTVAGG